MNPSHVSALAGAALHWDGTDTAVKPVQYECSTSEVLEHKGCAASPVPVKYQRCNANAMTIWRQYIATISLNPSSERQSRSET